MKTIVALALISVLRFAHAQLYHWTWIAGRNDTQVVPGEYGTILVGSPDNLPGARFKSGFTSIDSSMYLFGGEGFDSVGDFSYLNDMWVFHANTKEWTWLAGLSTVNAYSNESYPGSRHQMAMIAASNDKIYIYGGLGYRSRRVPYI